MISKIGNFLLLAQMIMSLIVIIRPALPLSKGFFYVSSNFIIIAFLLLVSGFIISDFSIQNIFLNSSTLKPLIYKISASWASHEGSMLFWLSLLSLMSIIYVYITSNNTITQLQLRILSFIILLFSSFIYFTSNPFIALSFKPTEGLGLNPVLQDIALSIHPPILYLGFVSYIVPFTNAAIILIKNKDNNLRHELFKISKIFSSFGLLSLTLGVGLGSWWAYRELGWGGFWFFDPVENISLLPWFAGIALHHSLIISVRYDRFINWTLMLSIISFLLTILGTLLVRSGILTSVHSFAASNERGIYLLTIFLLISTASIILLITKYVNVQDTEKLIFKEVGIKLGNILWMLSIIILLASIFYPLLYSWLFKESVSLSINFFVIGFLPIIILATFVAGVFSRSSLDDSHLIILVIALSLTIISTYKIKHNLISALAILGALYLILQTTYTFIVKSNFFNQKLSSNINAMILSHLGFGMLALSITLNLSLQKEFEFVGGKGENKSFNQFNINLKNIMLSEGLNYYRQIVEFWVIDYDKNKITILKPENRYYKIEKVLSQESDIYSYLTYDLYAVLNRVDENIIHAKIYYRPYISFIWLSIFIMASGFFISFIGRFKRLKERG